MYYVRNGLALFGSYSYSPSARSLQVLGTYRDSPAEDLRRGDRIVAINERPLDTLVPYYDAISGAVPGDVLTLDVEREGSRPRRMEVIVKPWTTTALTPAQTIAYQILNSYPLLFVMVGVVVLLERLEDRNAWLLALLFAGFIAGAPLFEERAHPVLRGPVLFYWVIFTAMSPALFSFTNPPHPITTSRCFSRPTTMPRASCGMRTAGTTRRSCCARAERSIACSRRPPSSDSSTNGRARSPKRESSRGTRS
jgi:hypothetical protein